MTKLRYCLVPLALAFTSGGVQADKAVERAVDYRQGVMNVYAYNVTSMKEQFGATAKTCKGCHDDFKN